MYLIERYETVLLCRIDGLGLGCELRVYDYLKVVIVGIIHSNLRSLQLVLSGWQECHAAAWC